MTHVTSYACTADLWTSRAQLSLTVLVLMVSFLCINLLETKEIPDSHTGLNIAEELEGVLQDWSLSLDGITVFMTDNGINTTEMLQCTRVVTLLEPLS